MSILDQLIEKKDLRIYLENRIKQLSRLDIENQPIKLREQVKNRKYGRIKELKRLIHILETGTLKIQSKKTFESNNKSDNLCSSKKNGHFCNLEKNHKGMHEARGAYNEILCVWDNE